jgi:hypothetical protein
LGGQPSAKIWWENLNVKLADKRVVKDWDVTPL